jgi:hypothetical protein
MRHDLALFLIVVLYLYVYVALKEPAQHTFVLHYEHTQGFLCVWNQVHNHSL